MIALDEWIDEVRDTAAKLSQYVDPKMIDKLLQVYFVSGHKEKQRLRNDVETILGAHMPKLMQSQRTVMPAPTDLEGEIEIGTIMQGDSPVGKFGMKPNDLTRHMEISAQSGHGKSVLQFSLQSQFLQKHVPFLTFDDRPETRGLLRKYKELTVIPIDDLRWNPLRPPPKMEIRKWWQMVSPVWGHAWKVYSAGVNQTLDYLDELYSDYQKSGRIPTLLDFYELMVARPVHTRKTQDYFDVLYNRVRSLVSVLGNVFNCEVGVKLEKLLELPVAIELTNLRSEEREFLINTMLSWLFSYRMSERHRGERLRHAIFSPEAQTIWDINIEFRDTTREMGQPIVNRYPTQARDLGEALILATQEFGKLSASVHANSLVKILGNMGNGTDIDAAAETTGLDDEQRDAIHKLKRGEWIVKMSDRYTEPFMIVTEDFPVDRDVSDAEVEERLLQVLPELKQQPETKQPEPNRLMPVLSDDARALMLDVGRHPFRGISRRQMLLGISGRRLELAKHELLKNSLVHETSIVLGKARPTKFLVPMESGLQVLRNLGENTDAFAFLGRQSFQHRLLLMMSYWTMKEAGYDAFTEWDIGDGRRLDVCASKDGKRIGVEVQLNANLDSRKLLASLAKVDELALITSSNRVREDLDFQANKILYPEVRQKVRIELARDFLERWKKVRDISDQEKMKTGE